MRSPETTSWHSASWQSRPAQQQPVYARPEGARAHRGADLAPAADRRVLGDRGAARAPRRGAARRGVRAAGRGLRRGVRRLRVGHHHQEAEDPAADESRAAARAEEADRAHRAHGRAVRQAALDRYRDARRRDAAELPRRSGEPPGVHRRGTRRGPGAAAARLRARGADAELRARAGRGRLRRPAPPGVLGPGLRAARAAEGRLPAHRALDRGCAGFLRGHQRPAGARGDAGGFLRQPRGPAPALRAGADALHPAPEPLVQPLDAHALDRHAHRSARGRARRVLPRHLQSHRA